MCFENAEPGEKWPFPFLVAAGLGVPAIMLLAYAILDQSVTIMHMWEGYADTEKDLKD